MLQRLLSFFKGWGIHATPEKDIVELLKATSGSPLFGHAPAKYASFGLATYKALGGRDKQIPNIKQLLPLIVVELNKKPYPPVLERGVEIPLANVRPWYENEYPTLNKVFKITNAQMYIHLSILGIDLSKTANYYGSTIVVTKSNVKKHEMI